MFSVILKTPHTGNPTKTLPKHHHIPSLHLGQTPLPKLITISDRIRGFPSLSPPPKLTTTSLANSNKHYNHNYWNSPSPSPPRTEATISPARPLRTTVINIIITRLQHLSQISQSRSHQQRGLLNHPPPTNQTDSPCRMTLSSQAIPYSSPSLDRCSSPSIATGTSLALSLLSFHRSIEKAPTSYHQLRPRDLSYDYATGSFPIRPNQFRPDPNHWSTRTELNQASSEIARTITQHDSSSSQLQPVPTHQSIGRR